MIRDIYEYVREKGQVPFSELYDYIWSKKEYKCDYTQWYKRQTLNIKLHFLSELGLIELKKVNVNEKVRHLVVLKKDVEFPDVILKCKLSILFMRYDMNKSVLHPLFRGEGLEVKEAKVPSSNVVVIDARDCSSIYEVIMMLLSRVKEYIESGCNESDD